MKSVLVFSLALICLSFTFKNKKFKGPEGYVFIPSGTIEMEGKKYSCAAFWMSDHEVTNGEYVKFLADLKTDGKMEDYKTALPDTSAWKQKKMYSDSMFKYYLRHPAYANYPVVNVSKDGAKLYCKYLTEKYLKIYGDIIQDFRLPTRMEWMYAAASGQSNARYSWSGNELRNEDGNLRANFRQVGDQNITLTADGPKVVSDTAMVYDSIDDNAFLTAPANSYEPNDYGLYNMCGNVGELVAKEDLAVGGDWHLPGYDIRIASKREFKGPNPFTGFRPVLTYIKQD